VKRSRTVLFILSALVCAWSPGCGPPDIVKCAKGQTVWWCTATLASECHWGFELCASSEGSAETKALMIAITQYDASPAYAAVTNCNPTLKTEYDPNASMPPSTPQTNPDAARHDRRGVVPPAEGSATRARRDDAGRAPRLVLVRVVL
jgi:hypothetical protein